MSHMSNSGRYLFAALFIAAIAGCASQVTSRDVTRSAKYHVGFVPGRIYKLRQDAALYQRGRDGGKSYANVASGGGLLLARVPKDCLYLVPIDLFDRPPLSTVPKGSRVRVDKLQYSTFVTLSDVHRIVSAVGTLLDAEDAGSTVILTYVSTLVRVPDLHISARAQSPDPTMLEELETPRDR